jgi:hypothetical protein
MRLVGMLCTLVALAGPVTAGELVLANGSRIDGELANEVLIVSTGADLIEIAPGSVGVLTPVEVRLRDGRVLRGSLVGGRIKARTALGELAIRVEELQSFRADGFAGAPATIPPPAATPATPAPAGPSAPPGAASMEPARAEFAGSREAGLPSVTLYQPATSGPQARITPVATTPGAAAPVAPSGSVGTPVERPVPGARLEVVSDAGTLHRDAVAAATPVGRVARGEQVMYLDSIDRRLRIFNALIFDGGYWIKVRAADGREGWLPAAAVREVR